MAYTPVTIDDKEEDFPYVIVSTLGQEDYGFVNKVRHRDTGQYYVYIFLETQSQPPGVQ